MRSNKNIEASKGRKYGNPVLTEGYLPKVSNERHIPDINVKQDNYLSSQISFKQTNIETNIVKNRRQKKYQKLQVYMNDRLIKKVEELCSELGVKKSQVMKMALQMFYKKLINV